MPDVTLSGRTQPKAKSINLEANILAEWYETDAKMQAQTRKRLLGIAAVALVGTTALPGLEIWCSRLARTSATLDVATARSSLVLSKKQAAATLLQPGEKQAAQLSAERSNTETFLGNVILVINAAPTSMVMDVLHAEVTGANLSIQAKCAAENYSAGHQFVLAASQGQGVRYAVQASTMKSDELSRDQKPGSDSPGVAFDFIKQVNLEP